MNRDKFEALPEIKTHLDHGNVFWSDDLNKYASEFNALHVVACYVNGAYYAFCEQEKRIEKISDQIDSLISESELWGFDSDQASRQLEIIQGAPKMTEQEIRDNKPDGATGYVVGRITGNIIYVKDNMVWCYTHNEWTSFVHNMEIKPL